MLETLIILAVNVIPYAYTWRRVFKKIAYYYVVKPRTMGAANTPGKTHQQLEPDWGDIGYAIVGATLAACIWPLVLIAAYMGFIMDNTEPIVVAEKLGGKAPPEVRQAMLQYRTDSLERELEMGKHIALPKGTTQVPNGVIGMEYENGKWTFKEDGYQ